MTNDERLSALGIALPAAPRPLGEYTAVSEAGGLVFLSGMLPLRDGKPAFTGHSGKDKERKAAKLAALNALSVLRDHFGTLNRIKRVVRLAAYIADFGDHAFVADGASELLNQVFSAGGPHVRLAFGVSSLPMNAAVELELILEAAG
jgi:enamine deaminase RidA (YjgF/YER057c/UK114 family)